MLSVARHQQDVRLASSVARGKGFGRGQSTMYLPVVSVPANNWNYLLAENKGLREVTPEKRKHCLFSETRDTFCTCRGRKFHRFSDLFHLLRSNRQKGKSVVINMRKQKGI